MLSGTGSGDVLLAPGVELAGMQGDDKGLEESGDGGGEGSNRLLTAWPISAEEALRLEESGDGDVEGSNMLLTALLMSAEALRERACAIRGWLISPVGSEGSNMLLAAPWLIVKSAL